MRLYPEESDIPVFEDAEQTIKYICKVQTNSKYAAEAYSIDFVDTTGKLPDLLIGSIPESNSGVTNAYIFALMMMIEKQSKPHNIHCTDSAGNSLQGLVRLATPSNYEVMDGRVKSLGLTMEEFVFMHLSYGKGFLL